MTNQLKALLAFLILLLPFAGNSQIDSLENRLESAYGTDRMEVLNQLILEYRDVKLRKSIKYGRESIEIGKNAVIPYISDLTAVKKLHLLDAFYETAESQFANEDFLEARSNYREALDYAALISDSSKNEIINSRLTEIQMMAVSGEVKDNFFNRTMRDINIGKTVNRVADDLTITTEIELAKSKAKNKQFRSAIDHYEKAINLLENYGEREKINELRLEIAGLLDSLQAFDEATRLLDLTLSEMEAEESGGFADIPLDTLPDGEVVQPLPASNADSLIAVKEMFKQLSEEAAEDEDYEKSLEYFKLYEALTIRIREDSIQTLEARKRREGEIRLLRQQKEISELRMAEAERDKAKEERIKKQSIGAGVGILAVLLITVYLYWARRRQHNRLKEAHRDLNVAKSDLEKAEHRVSQLLRQQVSEDVALELIESKGDEPGKRHFVCIMFLDIRDFTPAAEKMTPERLIDYQNSIFGFVLDIIESHHGVVNQLMGDGFMATFGAPISHGNDTQNAFDAATKIIAELDKKNRNKEIDKTRIGIGLHSGFVVTGNVGNSKRKQFSVTGNPVIIASRIEQLNKEFQSQLIISQEVYEKLDKKPELVGFRKVHVKGREDEISIGVVS